MLSVIRVSAEFIAVLMIFIYDDQNAYTFPANTLGFRLLPSLDMMTISRLGRMCLLETVRSNGMIGTQFMPNLKPDG
jgi:hypothetical protein